MTLLQTMSSTSSGPSDGGAGQLHSSPLPPTHNEISTSSPSASSPPPPPPQPPAASRPTPGVSKHFLSARERSNSRSNSPAAGGSTRIEVRLLVRRREAGALIGKRGANIKRLREIFAKSSFNIPDTGNGPERVVCIQADCLASLEAILADIAQLFLEKSCQLAKFQQLQSPSMGAGQRPSARGPSDQLELKQLINSAHAGLLIGMGGESIRKLRNDSKAAIKIYEMCCPHSNERVCAIKARPPVVVSTISMIHQILEASPPALKASLVSSPYDALNFDLALVHKYGGYPPDDPFELLQLACTERRGLFPAPIAAADGPSRLAPHSRPSGMYSNTAAAAAAAAHSLPSFLLDACPRIDERSPARGAPRLPAHLLRELAPSRFHPYLAAAAPSPAQLASSAPYARSKHSLADYERQLIAHHLHLISQHQLQAPSREHLAGARLGGGCSCCSASSYQTPTMEPVSSSCPCTATVPSEPRPSGAILDLIRESQRHAVEGPPHNGHGPQPHDNHKQPPV